MIENKEIGDEIMEKRYSALSTFELNEEIAKLNEKAKKAEQMGMVNEYAVYERKIALAKCYLLNPADYTPGQSYLIEGDLEDKFKINYMNGVFAWGHRLSTPEKEEALPISLLKEE